MLNLDEIRERLEEPGMGHLIEDVHALIDEVERLRTHLEPKSINTAADMYTADLEAEIAQLTEQKHALACGMLLAVGYLQYPQYERISGVIAACNALFGAIY